MQQLWLSGKRIDCIDQLRAAMGEGDVEDQSLLCLRLVGFYKKGILQAWLARQAQHKVLLGVVNTPEELEKAISLLKKPPAEGKMPRELFEALGVLCGVPAENFTDKEEQQKKQDKAAVYKQKWLKERGYWNEELFRSVNEWWQVVTNQHEYEAAEEKLNDRKDRKAVVELFLCRPEKGSYEINLRNKKNVIFTGVGDPKVRHIRLNVWEEFDARQNGLTFRNFTLRCPQREKIVVNHKDAENHFIQKKE